jgi:hypothetical protein
MESPTVTYADGDDASGMAVMLGGLLEDNMRDFPSRARVTKLARGEVVLTASDRDISVTLSFRGKEVVIANGPSEGATVLAGPWLEMAKLCSGQVNPVKAVARRELSIQPSGRLDAVAAAGYALSVPPSFYGDEEAVEQRRRQVIIAVAATATLVVTVAYLRRRRRNRRAASRG